MTPEQLKNWKQIIEELKDCGWSNPELLISIAVEDDIHAAVAEMQERCAKVAEELIDCTVPEDRYIIAYQQGRNDGAGRIARRIRELK